MVEPPELCHVSYSVDNPQAEVEKQEAVAAAEAEMMNETTKSESRSSLRKSMSKIQEQPEVQQQEAKAPPEAGSRTPEVGSKQETTLKDRKDVERPPIFVTLQ